MAKRTVFWRNEKGEPHRRDDGKDDDKCAPTAILEWIRAEASLDDSGKVSWPGLFIPNVAEPVIRSASVVFDLDGKELNDDDSWEIVWASIKAVLKRDKNSFGPSKVLKEADQRASEFFRKVPEDFVLVTSLSIDKFPARKIEIANCEVSAESNRKRFPYPDRVSEQAGSAPFADHVKSTQYRTVKISTKGRTYHDAVERGLDAVNLLRAYWSLEGSPGWRMSFSASRTKPMGIVHIGPIHTLHKPDGSLVSDSYWYEPDYYEDQKVFAPKNGWADVESDRKKAMRQISKLPYRRDLERLLLRYASALDDSDLDRAFLKMWGILEKLTDTVGARYQDTIDRVSWLYSDARIPKEMLAALRHYRNQYVHAARSTESREQYAYMIKSFVEPHLSWLIANVFEVDSIKEYGEQLDQPRDKKTLEKRRRQIKHALKMRTGSAKPKSKKDSDNVTDD